MNHRRNNTQQTIAKRKAQQQEKAKEPDRTQQTIAKWGKKGKR